MGARTYCQDIGRFLHPDPLFETFARHTPYHYSYNSPSCLARPKRTCSREGKGEERLGCFIYNLIILKSSQCMNDVQ